jgi:NAD(P)-dependent dehydrogenase (short-subunit alcohol dehydrogenase family)
VSSGFVVLCDGQELTRSRVDVSNIESLQQGFAAFRSDFGGKLDICIPCAGVNRNVGFLDTTFEEHSKLVGVNVMGVYHTAQLAAKQMIENGTKCGSIILVASIASYMAIRSQLSSAYCGTKGAVRAMCPAIAAELVKYVCPPTILDQYTHLTFLPGYSGQLCVSRLREDRNDSTGMSIHLQARS